MRVHKNSDFIEFEDFEVPLRDASDLPLWLKHPVHADRVDVVAVPITLPDHLHATDIEKFIEPMNDETTESVADDVFILSYPFGMSAGGVFPIWKRGSIASEPALDLNDLPMFYVDTASRSGMSGAPVVLFERRPVTLMRNSPENPERQEISQHRMKVLGDYSGRIGADDTGLKAQLGIVWKARVIDEVVSGGIRPSA